MPADAQSSSNVQSSQRHWLWLSVDLVLNFTSCLSRFGFCCRKAIREALADGESQDIADTYDTLNLLGAASQVSFCYAVQCMILLGCVHASEGKR